MFNRLILQLAREVEELKYKPYNVEEQNVIEVTALKLHCMKIKLTQRHLVKYGWILVNLCDGKVSFKTNLQKSVKKCLQIIYILNPLN